MKLKEGEEIVSEYVFGQTKRETGIKRLLMPVFTKNNSYDIKAILTTGRLIFLSARGEEHYPLSKITSLKTEHTSTRYTPLLANLIVLLLIIAPIIYYILFLRITHEKMSLTINNVLIYCAIPIATHYLFKMKQHFTSLVITQSGGDKRYKTLTNEKLKSFIDKVNETME